MAKQVLALIFFAAVGMASASAAAPSLAPAAVDGWVEGPSGQSGDGIIGTISGTASDAAPVGGPVPDGVFSDLTPAPAPANGVAALEVTTVVGAIAAAGVVGSFFF